MQVTTISATLPLPNEALLFDLEALYRRLQAVPDQRSRQGLRYPLTSILLMGVLAKLAGQDSSRGIAHWAQLRKQELRRLFAFKRETMPHYSTWSRVLGRGVDPTQLEQVLGDFFASSLAEERRLQRGGIQLCLDGKTLRGTIPLGQSQGVHLLAAYVPEQGVVLAQVQVNGVFDEPTQVPKLPRVAQRDALLAKMASQARPVLSLFSGKGSEIPLPYESIRVTRGALTQYY